jgi:deoxyribodipyrimidine photo-lyase
MKAIHQQAPLGRIWMHADHGSAASRAIEAEVRKWAREAKIRLTEIGSHGISLNEDDKDDAWRSYIRQSEHEPPRRLTLVSGIEPGRIPDLHDLGLPPDRASDAQHGGATLGRQALHAFLDRAGAAPADVDENSRIGPYLSWGNLSTRQVVHATRARLDQIRELPPHERGEREEALTAFDSQLRRRSAAIREFSEHPEVETQSLAPELDERRDHVDEKRFEEWSAGRTGYPLVDAAKRSLEATGWASFRMRALLVSFAAFDLWLPWRAIGLHLARLSLDFDPAIHWMLVQIHAGNTSPHAPRIYNPTKQAQEHDPDGAFIRAWLPELANVPVTFLHSPWLMPESMQESSGCVIGEHYPVPLVDHLEAVREAHRLLRDDDDEPAAAKPRTHSGRRTPAKSSDPDQPAQLSFPVE